MPSSSGERGGRPAVDVALQVGLDRARVERVGGDAVAGPAGGCADREEHVCGLGLPVGQQRVVGTEGEVEVVEDDGRGQVPARADSDKGLGEIGIVGVPAATATAVYHATGRRIRSLPITVEQLL